MSNDAPDWTSQAAQAAPVLLKQVPADSGKYTINDAVLHTYNFAVPAGAKALRFLATYAAGTSATQIALSGDFSNSVIGNYILHAFGVQPTATANDDTRRLVPGDSVLTLQAQLGAGSMAFMISAFSDTADLVAELGGNIGIFDSFPIVTRTAVTAAPAPWQAGTRRVPILASNVAAGAASILVPAVGGQQVRLARYELYQDGANAVGRWTFEDTTGAGFHDFFCAGVRGLLGTGYGDGFPITANVGAGLQIRNNGAAASFLGGSVTFQQF